MRFQKELCESVSIPWHNARDINVALDALARDRVTAIYVDEVLIKSKVAWKFSILRQALTYRLVDLGEATIEAWNGENLLASVVLARAFLETAALVHSVTRRMRKAVEDRSIVSLDELVMHESFGARKDDWVRENGLRATNVLTALDHMSREVEFMRDFYESLSETAHPNAFGTGQFYATTDKENIVVNLSRTKRDRAAIFSQITVALFGAAWSIETFKDFDRMILEIAELHADLDATAGQSS